MKIVAKYLDELPREAECIGVVFFEKPRVSEKIVSELDKVFEGKITEIIKNKEFAAKKDEIVEIYGLGKNKIKRVMLIGLGSTTQDLGETLRKMSGTLIRQAKKAKINEITLLLPDYLADKEELNIYKAISEGIIMGGYSFEKYKTKAKNNFDFKNLVIVTNNKKSINKINQSLRLGITIGRAVNYARDLANLPPNDLNPKSFVQYAKDIVLKNPKLKMELIDKKKAKALGMNAFLGVAQGSVNDPYIVVIRYNGGQTKEKPIALVGKGVTFDSGGISIKPSPKMHEMKADMSGAAAVLGTIYGLAEIQPKKNVLAVIPLVENMPSGSAQRPGDVVKAMNGKTIEIISTDAEGRMILADAMCYAQKQGISELVDIATLTGACSIALGDLAAAILGNNQKLINKFLLLSKTTGEWLWQLPLYDEYLDYLKSDIADMMNCNENRLAGTASAAKFLEQFVDKVPWVHIDIASIMNYSKTKGYTVKGMSGAGVRTLLTYVVD